MNRFIRRLEGEGLVQPGLTFHGLRHTYGTALKELGLGDAEVAALLGHSDERSARTYTRTASKRVHAEKGMRELEKSGYGKQQKKVR